MPTFYFCIIEGCEDEGSLELSYVGFFVICQLKEINEEVLHSSMLLAEFKLFSLEYQEWFDLIVDVYGFEGLDWDIVGHSKFEHV